MGEALPPRLCYIAHPHHMQQYLTLNQDLFKKIHEMNFKHYTSDIQQ